jgi:hypothetical protein
VRLRVQGDNEYVQISSGVENMPQLVHSEVDTEAVIDMSMPEDAQFFCVKLYVMVIPPHVRHHMDEWWATLKPSGTSQIMSK